MQHDFQVTNRTERGLAEWELHCDIKWLWSNLSSGNTNQKNRLHHAYTLLLNRSEFGVYTVYFSQVWVVFGFLWIFLTKVCSCCRCYFDYWRDWEASAGPQSPVCGSSRTGHKRLWAYVWITFWLHQVLNVDLDDISFSHSFKYTNWS